MKKFLCLTAALALLSTATFRAYGHGPDLPAKLKLPEVKRPRRPAPLQLDPLQKVRPVLNDANKVTADVSSLTRDGQALANDPRRAPGTLGQMGRDGRALATDAGQTARDGGKLVGDIAKDQADDLGGKARDAAQKAQDARDRLRRQIQNSSTDNPPPGQTSLQDRLKKAGDAAKNAADQAGQTAQNAATQAGDAVKDGAQQVGNAVQDGASKAGDAVKGLFGDDDN
jgi:colicin import membrane protein